MYCFVDSFKKITILFSFDKGVSPKIVLQALKPILNYLLRINLIQKYLIVRLFYEELYSKNGDHITHRDIEDLLDKSYVSKLQLKISNTLDENISEKEVLEVLKNMKK